MFFFCPMYLLTKHESRDKTMNHLFLKILSSLPPLSISKGWLRLVFVCVFVIWFLSSFTVGCSCLFVIACFFFFACLEFQIIWFVISTFTPIFFIEMPFINPPPQTMERHTAPGTTSSGLLMALPPQQSILRSWTLYQVERWEV